MTIVTPLTLAVRSIVDDQADESPAVAARLRRAMLDGEAQFRALAEAMPDVVWSAPPDGEPDYFNSRWSAYTGMAPERGRWTDCIHPDDVGPALAHWRNAQRTGEPFAAECRIRHASDGSWRWFLGRAEPLRDDTNAVVRWFGTFTEIDEVVGSREALARDRAALERLVAERAAELMEANSRLEAAAEERRGAETVRRGVDALYAAYIDNTTDGVFVVAVAPGGRIVVETANGVVERALAIRRDEIGGLALADLLPGDVAERLTVNLRACLASKSSLRYEEAIDLQDGERVFEVTLTPVEADGLPARVVGSARDLTERRRAEQQLRQAQKMEAVGQLTGGIAHDFNNLLQVVKGNLDLLALDLGDPAALGLPATVARRLRDAMAGAERGATLTRQLLAFSRRQPLAPKSVAVYGLIAAMAELLERTLGETVAISIVSDAPPWAALVDPAQLENAVLNLAINARDAMPDGGRLSIAVRNRIDFAGERVEIVVSDTGSGMSPAVLARVYEPFFSTKPEGRGTGLGLPQVQGFIDQSNGEMDIESAPGAGTTVRLSFARSAAPAISTDAVAAGDVRGRGESVLVLEDDDAVRRAVADLLAALGYRVTTAGSTREAEALLAVATFDLLLSDVVMPGPPSPPEVARAAVAARPGLKVLFMSGYAEDAIVHQGRIDADVHLIEKPYRKDELSLKLRQLLDSAPSVASTVPPPPEATPSAPAAPRRVLLVEDEPLIAMGVSDLLANFGYLVVEARTAADAQAAFRDGPPIDIVLTDLGLPDMDGQDLALWCRETRPGVPIVFSTGQTDFTPDPSLAAGGPIEVMTKPFNANTLRAALEACAV